MKNSVKLFCAAVLMSAICVGCRGGCIPTPVPPDPIPVPKEPQEVNFFYRGKEKIEFEVLKDLVIVKTASEAEAEALGKLDIFSSEDFPGYTMNEWLLASIDPEKTTIEDVRKLPGAIGAAYGMNNEFGIPCWTNDGIFVRPLAGTSIENVIKKSGLAEYVEKAELRIALYGVYLLRLDLQPQYIMWASCQLFETGMCEYAEPSFFGGAWIEDENLN